MPSVFTHFVFVDFENVQKVDLGLVEGKPVHVTLFIGKNQPKLSTSLSVGMNKYAEQVSPIEVGASATDALDIALAGYLGQSVERHPTAQFSIISKDKGYDPLIALLLIKGIKVARSDTFAAAFQPTKKLAATKTAPPARKLPVDRFAQLIEKLKTSPNHRPKKKPALLHHIATFYGNKLSDAEVAAILDKLDARRVLSLDDKGKVTYH